MGAYFVVLIVILALEAGAWLLTQAAPAGWLLGATLALGLGLAVLRLFLRPGAPDDRFPWE